MGGGGLALFNHLNLLQYHLHLRLRLGQGLSRLLRGHFRWRLLGRLIVLAALTIFFVYNDRFILGRDHLDLSNIHLRGCRGRDDLRHCGLVHEQIRVDCVQLWLEVNVLSIG